MYQIPNRSELEPAVVLASDCTDEVSKVQMTYSVGTARGGTNIVNNMKFQGPSAIIEGVRPVFVMLTITCAFNSSLSPRPNCYPWARTSHLLVDNPSRQRLSLVPINPSPSAALGLPRTAVLHHLRSQQPRHRRQNLLYAEGIRRHPSGGHDHTLFREEQRSVFPQNGRLHLRPIATQGCQGCCRFWTRRPR